MIERPGKPGERVRIVAEADDNHIFNFWSDGSPDNPREYQYGTQDDTLTANFTAVRAAPVLRVKTTGGGSVRIEPIDNFVYPKTLAEFNDAIDFAPAGATIDLNGRSFHFSAICERAPLDFITIKNGTIASFAGNPCVRIYPGARNWKFQNVTFVASPRQNNMVEVGVDAFGQSVNRPDKIPRRIEFVGCDFNGTGANLINGLLLNCNNFLVDNCKFHDITSNGESHAINVLYSNGPGVVRDSFIEAAGIGFFTGGAPAVPGIWPENIVVTGNFFTKNPSWSPPIQQKCHLELKTGKNIRISGNVFENNPRGQQVGAAIVFTPRDGTEIHDVEFSSNLIDNSHGGFQLMNRDHTPPIAGPMTGIKIHHNVLTRIASKHFLFSPTDGSQPIDNLIIRHNTCVHNQELKDNDSAAFIFANDGPLPFARNVAFEKNIATLGHNGILRSNGAPGQSSINELFAQPSVAGENVFTSGNPDLYPNDLCLPHFNWLDRDKGLHQDGRVTDEGAPAREIQEMSAAIRKRWA